MSELPLISIVMPVWNGAKHIREAIDSVLGQTFTNFEFIIVDDGSTDSTVDIVESYHDARLRIFRRDHCGIVAALNFGVDCARAEWIARHDADDISKPRRLELQWRAVSRQTGILCHTDVDFINQTTARTPKAWFPRSKALLALKLGFQCPIVHSTVLFRKSAFYEVGGYRPEERHAEDYSLWCRLISHGNIIGIARPLLKMRVHYESASRRNSEVQMSLCNRIALRHCAELFPQDPQIANRVHQALCSRNSREWMWFLLRCVPKLRWKSLELYTWLLSQTLARAYESVSAKPISSP